MYVESRTIIPVTHSVNHVLRSLLLVLLLRLPLTSIILTLSAAFRAVKSLQNWIFNTFILLFARQFPVAHNVSSEKSSSDRPREL